MTDTLATWLTSAVALALGQAGFQVQLGIGVEADLEAARADYAVNATAAISGRIGKLHERGIVPRAYQVTGIEWLALRRSAILADPMGSGKTLQSAVAVPERPRLVVICPASVKGMWFEKLRWLRPELFVQILHGRGSFRWPLPGQASILNWDILPEGLPTPPDVTVIADECHAAKNPSAIRTERFRAMTAAVMRAGGRCWGLTGTPLPNWPQDLWNVCESFGLAEEAFDTRARFVDLFDGEGTWGRMQWGKPSPDVPELLRRVMLRRRLEEILPELPPLTIRDIPVLDLPHDTRSICDEAMEALSRLGIDLAAVHDLTELTKAGIEGRSILVKARQALAIAKLPTMEALLTEHELAREPIVVFSYHRGPVEAAGARPGWTTITGAVGAGHRPDIIRDFQSGKFGGIALTIGAGGEGIELTHARHALQIDPDWRPGANRQAIARLRRMGQERRVVLTRLIADHPIDRLVYRICDRKEAIEQASVEASAADLDHCPGHVGRTPEA